MADDIASKIEAIGNNFLFKILERGKYKKTPKLVNEVLLQRGFVFYDRCDNDKPKTTDKTQNVRDAKAQI